ncbi:MAG TPA: hypothetical protein DD381_08900 [Lentisphaeria bacterium]|nr:MAG: hypothetical protein A2X47_07950 [Lentisphaerae bacterium GWF2_38_69]HBM16440.1 hypothetical protein [Lentisphaeria bacterium]
MKTTFVKKNWEKIVLILIFALLLLALIWLVKLFQETQETKATGLTYIVNRAPYKTLQPSFYNFSAELQKSILWVTSTKRDTNLNDEFYIVSYTDFMKPFKITRSNAPKADGKLIPYDYYKLGFCPITKEKLQIPDADVIERTSDSDADTIPDQIEKQYGLNPANPADAYYDLDKDSFTNLQDYQYNPNGIDNPKIHPPIIRRLILSGISKAKVPFIIKNIVKSGKNKKLWNIQINFDDPSISPSTKFLKIGSTVELPTLSYKITDIIEKTYEKLDPKLGTLITYDNSIVVLQTTKGEKIQAQVDKTIYEKDNLVIVKDIFSTEEYKIRINNTVTLGNSYIGIEEYILSDIIIDDTSANESLVFERDGKTYSVKNTTDYMKPLSSLNVQKKD